MIPKVIHYCWFGGKPLPRLGRRCLASWKKFLPDYEIMEWNESNFDVNCTPYVAEAYRAGKYAFVSDYARMWILYHHGGVYFDTDVEVIRPIDDILAAGPFMGCENVPAPDRPLYVALGLGFACEPGNALLGEFMEYYHAQRFLTSGGAADLTTVVQRVTGLLEDKGLQKVGTVQQVAGFNIYPKEYFCPIDTHGQVCNITGRTRTIHHYAATWSTPWRRFKKRLARRLGPSLSLAIISIKRGMASLLRGNKI